MARLPLYKNFTREAFPDAPDWAVRMFAMLNVTLAAIVDAMDRKLSRAENLRSAAKTNVTFTAPEVVLRNDLSSRPAHVWVTKLQRQDGVALAAAWSSTWAVNDRGELVITFQGLVAGDAYTCNVVTE